MAIFNTKSSEITSYVWQTLNGRVIFVNVAKPRTGFRGELPIARGPPEPSEMIHKSQEDLQTESDIHKPNLS